MDSRGRLAVLTASSIATTFALVLVGAVTTGLVESTANDQTQVVAITVGVSFLVLGAFAAAASVYLVGLYGRHLRDHARLEAGLPVAPVPEGRAGKRSKRAQDE